MRGGEGGGECAMAGVDGEGECARISVCVGEGGGGRLWPYNRHSPRGAPSPLPPPPLAPIFEYPKYTLHLTVILPYEIRVYPYTINLKEGIISFHLESLSHQIIL